jgi:transposase
MAQHRLPIEPHLTHDQIERRYRSCRSGLEKAHWQLLWLLSRPDSPLTPALAAAQVGLTPGWARAILKRWNADGPDGLTDRRCLTNRGQARLSPEQRAELYAALRQAPPDGGLWTGPKVAAYARDRFGVAACKQAGWNWLRGMGLTPQVPRPQHPEAATAAEPQVWKRRTGRPGRRASPGASREGGRAVGRG